MAMVALVREALRVGRSRFATAAAANLSTRIAQTVADRRLALVLLGAFAALALLLASLGVYSVMAHLVAFRTSEIGIRMALGASPGAVMRMVLGHSRRLTLVGIGLGVAGGFAVSRLMEQVLFEVDPADPLIYIAVSVDAAAGRRIRVVVSGAACHTDRSSGGVANGVNHYSAAPNRVVDAIENDVRPRVVKDQVASQESVEHIVR